ncbi:MAP kinase kinase Ste7 [Talaromyces stipitatus ATCC 10500]|uniref:MAP kinase kinase Ste7 n=1 Tax=Talaromyces stipitatus (strain ATCC 10500 / CBS 375.48 / QM 6759 / NRRL 1006) TaxID=441959 RepID=B8MNI1_TALSN|nr:MAP kinase kinase Ste7 [Talaromyces stipitatus ATCC 10500]EED14070.1 MAP kinase kinase Ste7 [Talaromyces stipitatus ATCC 10500]
MADQFKPRTMKRKNVKGLALNATPKPASNPSEGDAQVPGALGNTDSNRSDTLEIGLEFKLDLRSEDLVTLKEVGAGNGGTVAKVMHATTKVVMARKIIRVDAKENVRKQILRELQVGHDCNSPYIVTFYGAFQNESRDIVLCMEYMDCGSLDRISKEFGPVRIDVLGKITESILAGLVYLYETHRIMHRDIKPSNVLVNSRGNIKLCDFGVATETVNSVADTFVGTSTYMAPERIQGGAYTVRSDVWSVGLTVMELAVGRFPFDATDSAAGDRASAGPMGILDLLQQIVHEPAPKLPKSDAFPPILHEFVAKCLLKKPDERPTPRELYDKDAFLQAAKRTPVDLQKWARKMMHAQDRHSYLDPPAPASLKTATTTSSSPSPDMTPRDTPATTVSAAPSHPTPTFGEIPLRNDVTSAQKQHFSPSTHHSQQPQHASHNSRSSQTSSRQQSPFLSLEHLSLESEEARAGKGRSPRNYSGEPRSAIDAPSRPHFPRALSSSQQAGLHNGTLPTGAAPPPSGPLPPPPQAAGESWRNQYRARENMT